MLVNANSGYKTLEKCKKNTPFKFGVYIYVNTNKYMLSNDLHYIDHVIISRLKFCVLKWRRLRSNRVYICTGSYFILFERQFLSELQ